MAGRSIKRWKSDLFNPEMWCGSRLLSLRSVCTCMWRARLWTSASKRRTGTRTRNCFSMTGASSAPPSPPARPGSTARAAGITATRRITRMTRTVRQQGRWDEDHDNQQAKAMGRSGQLFGPASRRYGVEKAEPGHLYLLPGAGRERRSDSASVGMPGWKGPVMKPIDLTKVPDAALLSEVQRRRNAKRKKFGAGTGRPRV